MTNDAPAARTVRAAVVQSAPVPFDTPRTLDKLAALTADAARQRAELVVFPEAFVGGYWLDRAHWGKGIASRALHLLLREVISRPLVATAAASNTASLRVLQKCGFVVEQVRRDPATDRYPECEVAVHVLR